MTDHDEMENIETGDDLETFSKKYEITWIQEAKVTAIFLVGLAVLCAIIFAILFFTKDAIRTRGLNKRFQRVFMDAVSPETCEANLKTLTSKPHYAGTPEGEEMGKVLSDKLKELLDRIDIKDDTAQPIVRIYNETYESPVPHPETLSLEYTDGTTTVTALLEEAPITPGPDSKTTTTKKGSSKKEAPSYPYWSKSWIAFSGSANLLSREMFYVNYGTKEDFDRISTTDLNGKIVIARYGKIFRGQKVKLAAERGAAGVILYSDPMEDGINNGEVYPNGPWRPDTGIQRGSTMYLAQQPGDPTTPGHPSLPGTRHRIPISEATNIPKIPVLAISAADAKKFLSNLDGEEVPVEWVGGFTGTDFKYRFGTAANIWKINMNCQMNNDLKKVHNIFAEIRGTVEVDRKVMIGNHRDPWVYGATDPHSGTAVVLEIAKGLGNMLSAGWLPRRTIVIALWDAEEQGLIGSTEFVEQYRTSLANQLITYINVDNYAGDVLRVIGSPSLAHTVRETTKLVQDPSSDNQTAFDNWKGQQGGTEKPIPAYPGSGSDYTAFYHHLGVSVLDLSFRAGHGKTYGTYHSIHDNFDYFSKFIDPGFKVCTKLAQLAGNVLLKLTEDIILPMKIIDQSDSLKNELEKLKNSNEMRVALAALTPEQVIIVNTTVANVKRTIDEFSSAGETTEKTYHQLLSSTDQTLNYETRLRTYNDRVTYSERGFVSTGGLPGRGWYRNVVAAPGKDLGYGVEVFPAVREALRTVGPTRFQLIIDALSDLMEGIDASATLITGSFSRRNVEVSD